MDLTIKQENFCNFYVESGNASEAYRRAYSCEKMKDETINRTAIELLTNRKIATRVDELKLNLQKKSDITKERILNELSSIVFADIRDYVKFTVKIRLDDQNNEIQVPVLEFTPFEELTDSQAKAIESIKQTKEGFELKLHGKNWSIEKVCKMLGFDMPTVIENKFSDISGLSTEELIKRSKAVSEIDKKTE